MTIGRAEASIMEKTSNTNSRNNSNSNSSDRDGVPNARGKANLEALERGVNPLVPLRALRAAKAARRP